MHTLSLLRRRLLKMLTLITYLLATVQVVRFYMSSVPGIDLDAYLRGSAPLPFQTRYLPALLIRGMLSIPPLVRFLEIHHKILSPPAQGCSFLLSTLALGLAGYLCVRLYVVVSPKGRFRSLVYPLFLACVLLSYAVHVEQNTFLPYDFPSLAFFTAGVLFIYTHRFWALLAVMLVGTFNRETTLFLLLVYLLDGAAGDGEEDAGLRPWYRRFQFSAVPYLRLGLLCVVWAAAKFWLDRHFAGNDSSAHYIRFRENLTNLRPENWPVLLNICGYLLPFTLLLLPEIRPRRFGSYLLVAVPWVITMFFWGVITETRIYGEMVPLVTVASLLLLERQYVPQQQPFSPDDLSHP